MVNWRRIAFWSLLFYLVYTAPTEGVAPPVSVDIYPRAVMAGLRSAEVRIRFRIARHPDNRKYSFVMDADNGDYNMISGDLDGEYEQVTFPTCTTDNPRPCYRSVRPGHYLFEACVYRITEGKPKRFCANQSVEVR